MAESPFGEHTACNPKESICIDAQRIYDSCGDKDCLSDLRVYFTEQSQSVIDGAVSVRIKSADVITVYSTLEQVPFHRGFYSVDMTFFFDVAIDINVILGMVCENDGRTRHFPHKARHDRSGRGPVGMNDIGLEICQFCHLFRDQRITRPVSVGLRRCVKTRISDDFIGIIIVFAARIFGRADFDLRAVVAHHIVSIIHHYINNSVDHGRKRFV